MNAWLPGAGSDASGLRLALFSGNYNYTRDGANQALNRLVRHLEDAGAAVRVYSPTTATPAFEPAGELVSTPSIPFPGRSEYRLGLPLSPVLKRDIVAFRPTAVHLSTPDLVGHQAGKLARRLAVPVVASLHTRFETYLSYYGLGWLRSALERQLDRFYDGCDCVLAPNGPMAATLEAKCPHTQVRLWRRGVDRMQFSPSQRSLAWRRANGLSDSDVAVLFLGRLVREKGLDVLAETFALLTDQPHIRPLVVGDGPAAGWLRARLPNAVFTGFCVEDSLGRAVASADILFNPSQTEAFGNASLEAMAAGLAVLCPEAPSTKDLITSGHDGVLTHSVRPANFAKALVELARNPALRWSLGAAARQSSRAYDWRASCEAVLDVYREVGALPAFSDVAPRWRRTFP